MGNKKKLTGSSAHAFVISSLEVMLLTHDHAHSGTPQLGHLSLCTALLSSAQNHMFIRSRAEVYACAEPSMRLRGGRRLGD